MAIDSERLTKVMEYGLTEYEARTYLALVDLQRATAREVAAISRVPRTKIYSVLDDLHRKQLAQIIPERPKRYAPVPFAEYLRTFEDEYKRKLSKIADDKRLLSESSAPPAQLVERGGSFNVLKGRKNVTNKRYEMLGRAKTEIFEMGSRFAGVRLAYFMPILREKRKAGVDVTLLCPVDAVNAETVNEFREIGGVRNVPDKDTASSILVVDEEEALICHFVPDDEHLFRGDDVAIWTDDKAIVRDMRATIRANWELSEEAGPVLDRLLAKGPVVIV